MKLIAQFLAVSEAYRETVRRSDSTISAKIFGDGGRIAGLKAGKDMRSRSIEHGLQWFSDHWPKGAVWPSPVERPTPAAPAEGASTAADPSA